MPIEYAQTKKVVLSQKQGAELLKLYYETSIDQVKLADGTALDTKIAAIEAAISGQTTVQIVADIAARDALTGMKTGDQVWVKDATGDTTVKSGGAKYLYIDETEGWFKIGEAESMDLVITWEAIQDKPSSAVADIDDAVAKKHEHANKADLDTLSVVDGQVAVSGVVMKEVMTVSSLPETMPTDLVDGGLLIVG